MHDSIVNLLSGAKIDRVDKYGRSPLHVASAVDYSDMVEFLVSKGADIHARTLGEDQTPIHYAAKNDACNSLATLLNKGASIEDRDFKERTPLQVGLILKTYYQSSRGGTCPEKWRGGARDTMDYCQKRFTKFFSHRFFLKIDTNLSKWDKHFNLRPSSTGTALVPMQSLLIPNFTLQS